LLGARAVPPTGRGCGLDPWCSRTVCHRARVRARGCRAALPERSTAVGVGFLPYVLGDAAGKPDIAAVAPRMRKGSTRDGRGGGA
jgi:hypothetical protein